MPASDAKRHFKVDEVLVHKSKRLFDQQDWQLLRAENASLPRQRQGLDLEAAGRHRLPGADRDAWCCAAYICYFQPRVVKNHARAFAIAALLLSMLLLAQLAGIGNGPIYLLGVAPTILVAMILTIAYDQRFAIGIASMHGLLVTVALSQGVTFFVILWVGVLTASFLLDDIRTRSKLIEVGGAAALAMMAAAAAVGPAGPGVAELHPEELPLHRRRRPGGRVHRPGHPAVRGAGVPHHHQHDAAGAGRHGPPAAAALVGRGARHLQPQPAGRHAGQGRRRGDRRRRPAVPGGQLLPRRRARSTSPTTSSRTRPAARTAT